MSENRCETTVKVTKFNRRIASGTKKIDLKIKYTAQLEGKPPEAVTDAMIYVLVEKIDNLKEKVVDRRLTPQSVKSPAKDVELELSADSDMDLRSGNGVRITVMLVCNECPAVVEGPKIGEVT